MAAGESYNKEITVLVADDQALARELVKAIVKSLGFSRVIQAEDGVIAINKLNTETLGLVICDWNMPKATGLEVLRAARRSEKNRETPFILLTAEAYRENIEAALQAGVSEYVVKPFTPEILGAKIAAALAKKPAGTS